MGLGQSFPNKPDSVQDAFHSPCICIQNNIGLRPRDYVRFTDSGWSEVVVVDFGQHHGIVDPFVKAVQPGHWVNIMLVPELIGRLYHNFEMPSVTSVTPIQTEIKVEVPVVGDHFKDMVIGWIEEMVDLKVKEEEVKPDDDDWCTVERC